MYCTSILLGKLRKPTKNLFENTLNLSWIRTVSLQDRNLGRYHYKILLDKHCFDDALFYAVSRERVYGNVDVIWFVFNKFTEDAISAADGSEFLNRSSVGTRLLESCVFTLPFIRTSQAARQLSVLISPICAYERNKSDTRSAL